MDPDEVLERLQTYGPNLLHERKKQSPVLLFLRQFTDLLILILVISAAISGLLGEWVDMVAILLILILNGVIGFLQEYRAERALEALKQMSAPRARVIRKGMERLIGTAEIVPGDVVVIAEGDRVPADARLLESVALEADESVLTGESVPVQKDAGAVLDPAQPLSERVNMVFQGTVITRGRGRAVVTATGMQTELGTIATSVLDQPEQKTPLQLKLAVLGRQLSLVAIGLVALIFVLGILQGMAPFDIFLISVTLAVAAIPEGLPAVVTITLAIGVQRMAARHAVVRRLPAVETLGGVTVIGTDKTGTLTRNEMTVRKIYVGGSVIRVTGEGYSVRGELIPEEVSDPDSDELLHELLVIGVLCNTSGLAIDPRSGAGEIVGDPTEAALLVLAEKTGMDHRKVRAAFPCEKEIPFDAVRKMMTVICSRDGRRRAHVKGAPEVVLARCDRILHAGHEADLSQVEREDVIRVTREFGGEALRVLGFAYRDLAQPESDDPEEHLVFAGLVGMMDPPRPEAKRAVRTCHEAGIRVIMITGDNPETARAIALELGLDDASPEMHVVTGPEMDAWSDEVCLLRVRSDTVFARVNPEHKLRIVDALQACGEVVAMTGDGVNDAPAIVRADIGISMGITGTMVTREVSDMVIMDDNFDSIVRAVEEGRVIYANIVKSVRYLLSCNLGELAAITVAMLAGLGSPLMPLQILWMNIVTDSPPALALAVDPRDPDAMRRPPLRPGEPILTGWSSVELLVTGIVMALGTVGIFAWYLAAGPEYALKAGTMSFSVIVMAQMFLGIAFSGSRERSNLKTGIFKNRWLWLSVGFGAVAQVVITEWGPLREVFGTVPLAPADWFLVLAISLVVSVVPAGAKLFRQGRNAREDRVA